MKDTPHEFYSRRGGSPESNWKLSENPPEMPDIWSVRYVPLGAIRTERIVRDRWLVTEESVDQLQRSILRVGLLSPILLEPREDGFFELINGQRRLRAFEGLSKQPDLIGDFTSIPALVFPPAGRTETRYCRMVEDNLMQKALQPYELAHLATDFVADSQTSATTLEDAAEILFLTLDRKTRDDIVHFGRLMTALDGYVRHWDAVSLPLARALSVAIHNDQTGLAQLRSVLSRSPGSRDAEAEQKVLWKLAGATHVSRARCRLEGAEVSVSVRGRTPSAEALKDAILEMVKEIS